MNATFRPIAGYEDAYAISRRGIVVSLERVVMRSNGRPQRFRQRVLRQYTEPRSGLQRVCLSRNGDRRRRYVHKILAQTWGPQLSGTSPEKENENES